MNIEVRACEPADVPAMTAIWNEVVEDGVAFPQTEPLAADESEAFFASQTFTGVAVDRDTEEVLGLYTLHPNNIGRCGHLCNASYAVASAARRKRVGERLVTHCLAQASPCRFRILQFNAVVATNERARRPYERLGFVSLGTIPGGFLMKDGHYEDICLYYHEL